MSYKVLFDGNGSRLIRVVGLGDYMPAKDVEQAQAERDALVARVEELEICLKERKAVCHQAFDVNEALKAERDALAARIQTAERVEKIFRETPELTFDDCLKLFADEIRNVEFWAGRKGYLQGHLDALGDPDEIDKEHAAHRANEYAATVRKGGAE